MGEQTVSTLPKPFVFVLMPFDPKYDDIYAFGIKGAADDVGAYAERLDEQIFTEGMLDRIFSQISKADVIVADMTGRNPNVFYEVGYAHALGKIVLLVTQDAADIPFDLKQRPHIAYGGKIESLRKKLAAKLTWALVEARKGVGGPGEEPFSLVINDVHIPRAGSISEVPVIVIRDRTLQVRVRNDSASKVLELTHAYVFTAGPNPTLTEWEHRTRTRDGETYSVLAPAVVESFSALPIDAQDGLDRQFALSTLPGPIAPGATGLLWIDFPGQLGAQEEYPLRLRLHLRTRYYDFPFEIRAAGATP